MCKSKNGNRNQVTNSAQDEDFAVADGKTWKETFSKQFLQDRPIWEGKIKMCARWHIKGDCYNNCLHIASHITKTKSPWTRKQICSPS
jgi:hypothetical protein